MTPRQILGGAFDRLPESLRICFAHGGGAFPYLLGRLENAWHQRSIARGSSMHPPSHYLDRFSVDSAVFDERALRLLIETMGPRRVMLGSDYPFPLGEQEIGALVRGCGYLSDVEKRMVLGDNAASFFGVPLTQRQVAPHYEVVVPPPPLHAPQTAGYWLVGASSGARFASPPPAFALQYRPPGTSHLSARPLSSAHGPLPSATRGRRGLSTQPAVASAAGAEDGLHHHVSSHVDGMLCDATGGASLQLIDQASGKPRGAVPSSTAADVAAAVAAASRAFKRGEWAAASTADRARVLWRAAALLEAESAAFAAAESRDTGKPMRLAAAMDVPRAVANLRFFAGLVEHGSGGELRHGGGAERSGVDDALNYTVRKPVGVVGLVTPWNLPLYLLTWKLAPALAMGNAVVAKPSELTPTTATMLAGLLERAGLPRGIFNVVHGAGQEAGAALCSHESVGAISFTGGSQAGAAVAAAVAPRFAKLSLELGGKNAMLVFADCDVDLAVDAAVRASFLNAGQICLCASRILVQDPNPNPNPNLNLNPNPDPKSRTRTLTLTAGLCRRLLRALCHCLRRQGRRPHRGPPGGREHRRWPAHLRCPPGQGESTRMHAHPPYPLRTVHRASTPSLGQLVVRVVRLSGRGVCRGCPCDARRHYAVRRRGRRTRGGGDGVPWRR